MRKERNFPFVDQKVKEKGSIPVDEDGLMFLPPILWEKVLKEIRKREERKFCSFFKNLFKTKPSKKPMAVYKNPVLCDPD